MKKTEFEEGDVWAHRYGGTPERNAHILIQKIDDELYFVTKYYKIQIANTKPNHELLYFCGKYEGEQDVYFHEIFKKEGLL